jgi:isopenicillin N synthase-like dioxygenase
MKFSRRAALIVFIVALLAILAAGFFRATMHEDLRPEPAPAASAQQP